MEADQILLKILMVFSIIKNEIKQWRLSLYNVHAIKMSSTVTDKMMEVRNLFVYIEG